MDEILFAKVYYKLRQLTLLQIAPAHFIINCDRGLLQIATGTLLHIATSFITN